MKISLALLRLTMADIFLWAFFDKLFGLGYATKITSSWLNGGSPTSGFLKFGTSDTFKPFFLSLAGQPWVDWLFMAGLLLLGISLLFGIALRLAAYGGTLLMFLMWLSLFPPEHNPLIDEHVVYALALWVLYFSKAGQYWGLSKWWNKTAPVKSLPILA